MFFSKKTYTPNDAAEATIGQAGQDVAGMLVAIGQRRGDPDFVYMVDGFRPWSEYMKAIAAMMLNTMHEQITDNSQEFLDDYTKALEYHLAHAEGVEALAAELKNVAWMNDVIRYLDLPIQKLSEEVTKKIIKRSPLFKQDANLLLRYCNQRFAEAKRGLGKLVYIN